MMCIEQCEYGLREAVACVPFRLKGLNKYLEEPEQGPRVIIFTHLTRK